MNRHYHFVSELITHLSQKYTPEEIKQIKKSQRKGGEEGGKIGGVAGAGAGAYGAATALGGLGASGGLGATLGAGMLTAGAVPLVAIPLGYAGYKAGKYIGRLAGHWKKREELDTPPQIKAIPKRMNRMLLPDISHSKNNQGY